MVYPPGGATGRGVPAGVGGFETGWSHGAAPQHPPGGATAAAAPGGGGRRGRWGRRRPSSATDRGCGRARPRAGATASRRGGAVGDGKRHATGVAVAEKKKEENPHDHTDAPRGRSPAPVRTPQSPYATGGGGVTRRLAPPRRGQRRRTGRPGRGQTAGTDGEQGEANRYPNGVPLRAIMWRGQSKNWMSVAWGGRQTPGWGVHDERRGRGQRAPTGGRRRDNNGPA